MMHKLSMTEDELAVAMSMAPSHPWARALSALPLEEGVNELSTEEVDSILEALALEAEDEAAGLRSPWFPTCPEEADLVSRLAAFLAGVE